MLIIIGILLFILAIFAFSWAVDSDELLEFVYKFAVSLVLVITAVWLITIGDNAYEEDTNAALNQTTEQKDENYMRGYKAGIEDMANQRVIIDTVFVYTPKNN